MSSYHPSLLRRFIARPCAMGLKIQTNGPQKAQANAILEKVFTAITKVVKKIKKITLCFMLLRLLLQHTAPSSG